MIVVKLQSHWATVRYTITLTSLMLHITRIVVDMQLTL